MAYLKAIILAAAVIATLPTVLSAVETSDHGPLPVAPESIPTMGQVTVIGHAEDPLTLKNTLDRTQLSSLPARNGSINEALDILPGIQLGEEHRTSDNAGEILPPSLSISGGRFYENNFMIDGIGNNSLLDPSNSNIDNTSDTPGHPQENFLHPSLIENVTVFRSNISAKYGQFTGGVVEIETRDPAEKLGGSLSIRHTRSEWTTIHKDHDRKDEYENPHDGSVQPKFRKYDGSFSVDLPINENMGLLAGYSQTYSKIPLLLIDQTETQHRTLESYFLKYVAHLGTDAKWTLTGSYIPYEAKYFRDEAVDSRYTLDNDAYSLTSNFEQRLGRTDLEFDFNYRKSTNSREAPDNAFNWQVTPSKPWGAIADAGKTSQYSKEGGFGDLDKEQETYSFSIHATVDPLRTGSAWHNLKLGAGYEDVDGSFIRNQETANHILARKNENVVCDGSIDCINGEQFMWYKLIYPSEDTTADIQFYDVYLEDQITVGHLTMRPGVRLSYDDLQENTNWAPRLSAGYDLFGDGTTQLFAGVNRYYGKTLLGNALKDNRAPAQVWTRPTVLNADDTPGPWSMRTPTTISTTRFSDLNTPYTDEITLGFDQKLFGGLFNLTYIDRESDDELASTVVDEIDIDGDLKFKYTEWTNDGSTSHEEVSAYWERQWPNHYLLISATWQETETSNSDYAQRGDYPDDNGDGIADPVWYKGELYDREDLPRPDYNRKYSGAVTYIGTLPHGFSFTNVTRYRSGYYNMVDTGMDHSLPSGENIPVYEKKKQPESWIFDWRLDWEKHIFEDHIFIATMEINNVFDEKIEAGGNDDVYELGRQFWLGVTYKY